MDRAFDVLDSSWHPNKKYFRYDFLRNLAWSPMYRNLHDDPRWQDYLDAAQTSREALQEKEFCVKPALL